MAVLTPKSVKCLVILPSLLLLASCQCLFYSPVLCQMQSLILPPTPFVTTPQFGLPRFDSSPERFPLDRSCSTHARGYSPRALPLPRPMSNTVPGDDLLEISGHTRRLGHPELPQPLTTTTGVSGPIAASTSPATASTQEYTQPPLALHDPSASGRWPPSFGPQGVSQHPEVSYPPSVVPTSTSPGAATRNLQQKPTRRTKAHVASACVNCKKKHLGCDSARPCRRCVLSGKSATCVDVTHKKRGRPPLKAEEASLRPYSTRFDQSSASGDLASQSSRCSLHRTSGSREIRPMTDLQMTGAHPGSMGLPPQRWSTSMFTPQAVDPALTMPGNPGHRRFSSAGSIQPLGAAAPPAPGFVPMGGPLSPVFGGSRMPPVMGRPPSSYANQPFQPQTTSSPTYQPLYGGSPYMSRQPMGESPLSRDPQESYLESPVRLPPIYPPMPSAGASPPGQGHRLSDPFPTSWSPRTREELPPVAPQHQPSLMEPVSPHTQTSHYHHGPTTGATDFSFPQQQTIPRPPESITPAHRHSVHLPSSTTHTHARDKGVQSGAEGESGDGRPTKRRKMALDDMVND